MHKNHWLYTILLILTVILLAGCSTEETTQQPAEPGTALDEVRLPMGYIPSVQFAPFYAADKHGFFMDEGIKVTFDYSFETDGVALVAAGETPFALGSGEQVLLARSEGLPVVYVMSWYRDYPVGVAAPAQGIENPGDLVGKTIGVPGLFGASYIGLRAMLDAEGISEMDLTLDSIGYNQVEMLLAERVDAAVVYVNNEPILLADEGMNVDVLRVSDYVTLASNGLITSDAAIKENPELVQRMVRAVVRGIRYTLTHPNEAFTTSLLYVEGLDGPETKIQKDVLLASLELYQQDPIGKSSDEAWENMQSVLLSMGLIDEPVELQDAFTNQFVP